MKLLIIGVPRAGKTTKALDVLSTMDSIGGGTRIIHTDDLAKKYEWSVFSDKVCDLLKQDGPWIIEGCSAVRGLRKYLKEGNTPDFEIMWLGKAHIPLVSKQIGFAASLKTMWKECQAMMPKYDYDYCEECEQITDTGERGALATCNECGYVKG